MMNRKLGLGWRSWCVAYDVALSKQISALAMRKAARFLLPRSQIGRDVLYDGLRALGAEASPVTAYRTVPPEDDVQQAVADGEAAVLPPPRQLSPP